MSSAVLGTITGPIISKFLPVRTILVGGEFVLALILAGVAAFSYFQISYGILVCMIIFMFIYQNTLGSYYMVYVSQVGGSSVISAAMAAIWIASLIVNFIT